MGWGKRAKLRAERGSKGDSQGPMALERVRAGPAVAPPAGGEARRGRRAAKSSGPARPGNGYLHTKRRARVKPFCTRTRTRAFRSVLAAGKQRRRRPAQRSLPKARQRRQKPRPLRGPSALAPRAVQSFRLHSGRRKACAPNGERKPRGTISRLQGRTVRRAMRERRRAIAPRLRHGRRRGSGFCEKSGSCRRNAQMRTRLQKTTQNAASAGGETTFGDAGSRGSRGICRGALAATTRARTVTPGVSPPLDLYHRLMYARRFSGEGSRPPQRPPSADGSNGLPPELRTGHNRRLRSQERERGMRGVCRSRKQPRPSAKA